MLEKNLTKKNWGKIKKYEMITRIDGKDLNFYCTVVIFFHTFAADYA